MLATHRVRRLLLTAMATIGLLVGAVGCGSGGHHALPGDGGGNDGGGGSSTTLAKPVRVNTATATVRSIDNDFSPKNLVVRAGTKVTFENTGHNAHNVVPVDPKRFDFTVPQARFAPHQRATFDFSKPGTYVYYCSIHATPTAGTMRGEITVVRR